MYIYVYYRCSSNWIIFLHERNKESLKTPPSQGKIIHKKYITLDQIPRKTLAHDFMIKPRGSIAEKLKFKIMVVATFWRGIPPQIYK